MKKEKVKKSKYEIWKEEYDHIEWSEFKNYYFKCEKCGFYSKEGCICYAR